MENIIDHIVMFASLLTALATIYASFKVVGKKGKETMSSFVTEQLKPVFDDVNKSLNEIKSDIDDIKSDADEETMQRLRYECLCFASDVRKGDAKTRQEYEEIFRMETKYDSLIEKYNIKNGYMEEEMRYVHEQYRKLSN